MTRPKFLHTILSEITAGMSFPVSYDSVTDNAGDSFTLNGVCDFHHVQPGFTVTIGGHDYLIVDYDATAKTITVEGTDPLSALTFNLYKPIFVHGTPMQQEAELKKISLSVKTPMIYLMEPYHTENDYTALTSIDQRCDFTLCFLTQADIPKWLTKDFYHKSITPMKSLMEDTIQALVDSNLFYNVKQKAEPKFYTKFGINIKEQGTKQPYFSENLSGVGVDLHLEIYAVQVCEC